MVSYMCPDCGERVDEENTVNDKCNYCHNGKYMYGDIQMVSDNFMDDWEAASYDVGPCQDCDQKLDLMVEEYDKCGTHYFNENSFCCSSAWQQIIPLEELR